MSSQALREWQQQPLAEKRAGVKQFCDDIKTEIGRREGTGSPYPGASPKRNWKKGEKRKSSFHGWNNWHVHAEGERCSKLLDELTNYLQEGRLGVAPVAAVVVAAPR